MRTVSLILFFSITILFVSCFPNYRLKKEVFDKVELGMSMKEVKDILGEPKSIIPIAGSRTNYCYLNEKNLLTTKYAVVTFDSTGRVSFSHYENPE